MKKKGASIHLLRRKNKREVRIGRKRKEGAVRTEFLACAIPTDKFAIAKHTLRLVFNFFSCSNKDYFQLGVVMNE